MAKRVDAMVGGCWPMSMPPPSKRSKIATIFKGATTIWHNAFATHAGAQAVAELLTQPTIDRAQVEQLRVQQMQLGETASRRITQAILDAADVVNRVQRTQLAQKLQEGITMVAASDIDANANRCERGVSADCNHDCGERSERVRARHWLQWLYESGRQGGLRCSSPRSMRSGSEYC